MNLQAEELRRGRATEAPAPQRLAAPFLALGGGKGGVGKTTLAANLGWCASLGGCRTLLVDLDFALANLDVVLGLEPRQRIDDAYAGRAGWDECVVSVRPGLDLLPAASGAIELARGDSGRRAELQRALCSLSADYDLVIGDSAAGIGPDVLEFAGLCDIYWIVTTPDPSAIADAYGVLKALDAFGAERGFELPTPELIVNLASGAHEAQAISDRLAAVAERFLARRPRMAGWLPRATAIERAGRERRAFSDCPEGSSAKSLERLAARALRDLGIAAGRGGS